MNAARAIAAAAALAAVATLVLGISTVGVRPADAINLAVGDAPFQAQVTAPPVGAGDAPNAGAATRGDSPGASSAAAAATNGLVLLVALGLVVGVLALTRRKRGRGA